MATIHAPAETSETSSNTPTGTDTAQPRNRRRTVKRALGVTALTLGAAVAGGYFWLDSTADVKAAGNPDCATVTPTGTPAGGQAEAHRAVCATLSAMTDAWGRGDGAAYGACFTPDATDVTFVGTVYRGADDIGRAHQALFDSFLKGTRLHLEVIETRFLTPDAAIVVTRGEVAKKPPKRLGKRATYTLVRDADGTWRIAAVQKTKHNRLMEAISFMFQPRTAPAE
ncbi:SgcJ/EcaC family oxidoreductase [Streptomyces coffeae]|uniref:SgcJ/EcaC family oxidoreductase n=1 Tax=Streptomyces coffeae TaxID=621382 RepID=A0ABS1N7V1_9ACTN|nr:SgcJ/EcaC family oxidoreductase [Streptomyces coffeae]MBL1096098.1 SgcJ/EcaC family oxidoreductase [Streptomyces coffeae]